jgi:hypothetical protein
VLQCAGASLHLLSTVPDRRSGALDDLHCWGTTAAVQPVLGAMPIFAVWPSCGKDGGPTMIGCLAPELCLEQSLRIVELHGGAAAETSPAQTGSCWTDPPKRPSRGSRALHRQVGSQAHSHFAILRSQCASRRRAYQTACLPTQASPGMLFPASCHRSYVVHQAMSCQCFKTATRCPRLSPLSARRHESRLRGSLCMC